MTDEEIAALAQDLTCADPNAQADARRRVDADFGGVIGPLLDTYHADTAATIIGSMGFTGGSPAALDCALVALAALSGILGVLAALAFHSILPLAPFIAVAAASIPYLAYRVVRRDRIRDRYLREQEEARARARARVKLAAGALDLIADRRHLDLLLAHSVRAVGDEWTYRDPDDPVYHALARILPTADDDDTRLVNGKHRHRIQSFLTIEAARQYETIVTAMVETAARLGDARFLKPLRGIAEGPATSPQGLRVRAAARRGVESMTARLERERLAETMLRPSDRPQDEPATLLRPLQASTSPDSPDLLLRPSTPTTDH